MNPSRESFAPDLSLSSSKEKEKQISEQASLSDRVILALEHFGNKHIKKGVRALVDHTILEKPVRKIQEFLQSIGETLGIFEQEQQQDAEKTKKSILSRVLGVFGVEESSSGNETPSENSEDTGVAEILKDKGLQQRFSSFLKGFANEKTIKGLTTLMLGGDLPLNLVEDWMKKGKDGFSDMLQYIQNTPELAKKSKDFLIEATVNFVDSTFEVSKNVEKLKGHFNNLGLPLPDAIKNFSFSDAITECIQGTDNFLGKCKEYAQLGGFGAVLFLILGIKGVVLSIPLYLFAIENGKEGVLSRLMDDSVTQWKKTIEESSLPRFLQTPALTSLLAVKGIKDSIYGVIQEHPFMALGAMTASVLYRGIIWGVMKYALRSGISLVAFGATYPFLLGMTALIGLGSRRDVIQGLSDTLFSQENENTEEKESTKLQKTKEREESKKVFIKDLQELLLLEEKRTLTESAVNALAKKPKEFMAYLFSGKISFSVSSAGETFAHFIQAGNPVSIMLDLGPNFFEELSLYALDHGESLSIYESAGVTVLGVGGGLMSSVMAGKGIYSYPKALREVCKGSDSAFTTFFKVLKSQIPFFTQEGRQFQNMIIKEMFKAPLEAANFVTKGTINTIQQRAKQAAEGVVDPLRTTHNHEYNQRKSSLEHDNFFRQGQETGKLLSLDTKDFSSFSEAERVQYIKDVLSQEKGVSFRMHEENMKLIQQNVPSEGYSSVVASAESFSKTKAQNIDSLIDWFEALPNDQKTPELRKALHSYIYTDAIKKVSVVGDIKSRLKGGLIIGAPILVASEIYEAYQQNALENPEEREIMKMFYELGDDVCQLLLDLLPITGSLSSMYSTVSGKEVITGQDTSRGMAALFSVFNLMGDAAFVMSAGIGGPAVLTSKLGLAITRGGKTERLALRLKEKLPRLMECIQKIGFARFRNKLSSFLKNPNTLDKAAIVGQIGTMVAVSGYQVGKILFEQPITKEIPQEIEEAYKDEQEPNIPRPAVGGDSPV